VFLLVILITEIAIGIVAFVNRDGWNTAIRDSITDMFGRYDESEAMNKDINSLQRAVSHTRNTGRFSFLQLLLKATASLGLQKYYVVVSVQSST
jgi:hypothetical protein